MEVLGRSWNYHVRRGFRGNLESTNLSRDDLSREIGRSWIILVGIILVGVILVGVILVGVILVGRSGAHPQIASQEFGDPDPDP